MVIWQLDGVGSVDHERFRGRCLSGTGSAGYAVFALMRGGVVTRCCGLFQARSPVRSVVCGDGIGPDEGGFHAVGHGCCLVISAAMFLQGVRLLLRTELCRRSFRRQLDGESFVIRHPGVEGAIGV